MVKYLLEKLASIYARKIAGWILTALTLAAVQAGAWLVAKYPEIAGHFDPHAVANWLTVVVVAPLINHLGNAAKDKEHDNGLANTLARVATELTDDPPETVVKAVPLGSIDHNTIGND
ncbi:MAG: hypothetical protein ACFUZC_10095 [Chthoniobacteraceae bacterium]